MINALFRTGFASNTTAFIVFLALNALLGLLMLQVSIDGGTGEPVAPPYGMITMWLVVIGLVAGGQSLLYHNRERRSRFYAQLPVTALQVRLAYWCHAGLYVCISTLVMVLVMVFADDLSAPEIVLFALLYLFHGGAVTAVLSIVTGNSLRLIPDEIRRRTIVYFFLATFVTFLVMLGIGFGVTSYVYVLQGDAVSWGRLTLVMALLCAALTAWDVQLFRKRENYLG